MRNIQLIIEYDGSNFKGWQIQPRGQRTVQGEIVKALKTLCKEEVTLIGSGRTDTGVHALGQVANFKTQSSLPAAQLQQSLNGILPRDMAILTCLDVALDFHAQYSAKQKSYRYTILNRTVRGVVHRQTQWHHKYALDVELMQQEAKALVGMHDFKSFCAADPRREHGKSKDTVRTVYVLDVMRQDDRVIIDITANGFLYKMVRNIVGTLVDAGQNRLAAGGISHILTQKDRNLASPTAPAHGLCLMQVMYEEDKTLES